MSEEQDPFVGSVVRDYVLVRLLGRGAMASVYLGQHQQTEQKVAVKLLASEFAVKNEFIQRFIHEASACAALKHENIIHVYETGQENGTYFMIMEYVEGFNLAHFLEVQDKIKESQALPWIKQAAQALGYAHSHGIVHRDLKPDNIMLTYQHVVKIADLGLSKKLEADENYSMTMSGTVIGTPYYISPEQARDAKHVDARTDIYSLGATFYHLLTGYPPFEGSSAADVMSKHMSEVLISPQRRSKTLSDGFSDLILKMMEKDPAKRFENMKELILAIERLERGEAVILQKVKLRTEPSKSKASVQHKKSPFLRWSTVLISLAVLLIVIAIFGMKQRSFPPKKEQPSIPIETTTALNPKNDVILAEATPLKSSDDSIVKVTGTEAPKTFQFQFPSAYNWIDTFCILFLLIGALLAREVGWLWSSVRAVALWGAVIIVCLWFKELASLFHQMLAIPTDASYVMGYLGMSAVTVAPAWILTNRLFGHKKENWRIKLDRFISIFPGFVIGAALATWLVAFSLIVGAALPLKTSWIGSKILDSFPAVREIVPRLK